MHAKMEGTYNSDIINQDKAMRLLPLLHKLRIADQVQRCDMSLSLKWRRWNNGERFNRSKSCNETDKEYQTRIAKRSEDFKEALELMEIATYCGIRLYKGCVSRRACSTDGPNARNPRSV